MSEIKELLGKESLVAIKDYIDIKDSGKEVKENKTTILSDASTDEQYPSAKAVVDYINSKENLIKITYDELKQLKDNGQLVPGTQYQITDYRTQTSQDDTSSAGHQFDIIVTADSESVLNENARATYHEGDTYFIHVHKEMLSTSFKDNITIDDVQVLFRISEDGQEDYEVRVGEKPVTELGYYSDQTGVAKPALFNPDPNEEGNDLWYIYQGQVSMRLRNKYVSTYCVMQDDEIKYDRDSLPKEFDIFVDFDYNEEGTPIMYKTDIMQFADEIDYEDVFTYNGTIEVDGEIFDCWLKWDPEMKEDEPSQYYLTNVIVENGQFIYSLEELRAGFDEEIYDKWLEYNTGDGERPEGYTTYGILTNPIVDVEFGEDIKTYLADLSSWQIKYSLENQDKYNWRVKTLLRLEDNGDYVRTPQFDQNGHWAWCYLDDAQEIDENDRAYTDPHPVVRGQLYVGENSDVADTHSDKICGVWEGTGVIYYMKDEWGNECGYDFKNILFWDGRYTFGSRCDRSLPIVVSDKIDTDWKIYHHNIIKPYYTGCEHFMLRPNVFDDDNSNCMTCNNILEANCNNNLFYGRIQNNKLGVGCSQCYLKDSSNNVFDQGCSNIQLNLECNNNTFGPLCYSITLHEYCNTNTFGSGCNNNRLYESCYNNIFGKSCSNNTLRSDCHDNIFGNICKNNYLNYECRNNIFGTNCHDNELDYTCYGNRFGVNCYDITLGSSCIYNTFNDSCYSNTLGWSCQANTFGSWCVQNNFSSYCSYNVFDTQCNYNKFNQYCSTNTLGSKCNHNTFDKNCCNNTFGSACTYNTFGVECTYNIFDSGCANNTFGNNCCSNTLGNKCYENTFGENCCNNTFGNNCVSNTFAVNCKSNTLGSDCYKNSFGVSEIDDGQACASNTLGRNCNFNSFGDECYNNLLGDLCEHNTFTYSCSANTLANSCSSNTFARDCFFNTFGNDCNSNDFGEVCSRNTFGHTCRHNTFAESYISYNELKAGVSYINLTSTSPNTASGSNLLQNIIINPGVKGKDWENKRTITIERNLPYSTTISAPGSKEIILDEDY